MWVTCDALLIFFLFSFTKISILSGDALLPLWVIFFILRGDAFLPLRVTRDAPCG